MKKLIVGLVCSVASMLMAQDMSAANAAVEDQPTEGKIESERGADEMMQEFLDSRPNGGWSEGANEKNGSIFVVQKGVGAIQAKPDSLGIMQNEPSFKRQKDSFFDN